VNMEALGWALFVNGVVFFFVGFVGAAAEALRRRMAAEHPTLPITLRWHQMLLELFKSAGWTLMAGLALLALLIGLGLLGADLFD
jgi:hypothetical protein